MVEWSFNVLASSSKIIVPQIIETTEGIFSNGFRPEELKISDF